MLAVTATTAPLLKVNVINASVEDIAQVLRELVRPLGGNVAGFG
jgi:hypothetical protein